VCLHAQRTALPAVRAGANGPDVDAVARDVISAEGLGELFGHGLGHGVGLELQEQPWLNPERDNVLVAGGVVTVEPGIYHPGLGGAFVRTKLKALESRAVVDRTFRAGEKFSRVHTEVKSVQYLYDGGDGVVFMDERSYEQLHLVRSTVEDALEFLQPSGSVQ